jgi:hypothetical protein
MNMTQAKMNEINARSQRSGMTSEDWQMIRDFGKGLFQLGFRDGSTALFFVGLSLAALYVGVTFFNLLGFKY